MFYLTTTDLTWYSFSAFSMILINSLAVWTSLCKGKKKFACLRATYITFISSTIDFFSNDRLSIDKVGNIISMCLVVVAYYILGRALAPNWNRAAP